MTSVLETLSINELMIRKENLLKQLEKVEIYIKKLTKNNNENSEIKEYISEELKKDNRIVKIKINIKKINIY